MPQRLNDNERRGVKILELATGWPVVPWPGWAVVAERMDAMEPPGNDPENDSWKVWSEFEDGELIIVPDACAILPCGEDGGHVSGVRDDMHTLVIVEVETTWGMTEEKRGVYAKLWDAFRNSDSWQMQLVVCDANDSWHALDMHQQWEWWIGAMDRKLNE